MKTTRVRISLLLFAVCSIGRAQEVSEPSIPLDQTEPPVIEIKVPENAEIPAGPVSPEPVPDPMVESINRQLQDRGAARSTEQAQASGALPSGGPEFSILQWISGLLFVIALIILAGLVLRKIGAKTPLLAGANLANVIGRVHLARGATLHYVRTGGRVLIVGVTNNAISLVAEFDAQAFDLDVTPAESGAGASSAETFLAQLRQSSRTLAGTPAAGASQAAASDDDEINALRNDIQRLQHYLQDETRVRRD